MAAESGDRTEAATPRRLQRARDEGQVAISPELSALFALGMACALLMMAAPAVLHGLSRSLAGLFAASGRLDGPSGIAAALRAVGMAVAPLLAGLLAVGIAAGAATALQTGLLISPARLKPDLTRLSPARGLHRVFGPTNLFQAGKSMLKLALVGGVLWTVMRGRQGPIVAALSLQAAGLTPLLGRLISVVLMAVLGVQGAIAGADLLVTRLRHSRSLRMSRAEQKQEAREADGSPEVKQRLRRLRAQRARHRMVQAVARATVVVTNPTHYAVALAYDRSRNAAPRVVAKGMDEMAARIRAVAEEHRVPMVANPPLARALHRVELDADLPPEHYQAVAELIAYVWRLQGQARRRPG